MSRMLGSVETLLPPDDRQIFIVGGDDPDAECSWEPDRFVYCGDDVVTLDSASDLLHDAWVRVEAWDAEPSRPDGDWEAVEDGRVRLSVGSVAVGEPYATDIGERLALGEAGWYHVRAFATGREALLRWQATWDGNERPVGLERFVVQLWPAPPIP